MYLAYSVVGGMKSNPAHFYVGFARLLDPFFMGLLFFRMNKLIKICAGFWWRSLLVIAILAYPRIGGEYHYWRNGAYEAFCIIVMFPLIIAIGARSTVTGKRTAAICYFLGEISYPLYITHCPFMYLHTCWVVGHTKGPRETQIYIGVTFFILCVGVAYACLKLFDIPMRTWLQKRYLVQDHQIKMAKKSAEIQMPEHPPDLSDDESSIEHKKLTLGKAK